MIPQWLARTLLPTILPDIEPVTYGVRTTSGGVDSFTNYTLYRAKQFDITIEELAGMGMGGDFTYTWTRFWLPVVSLDNAGAPYPALSYTITEVSGIVWFIQHAAQDVTAAQYDCLCRKNLT